MMKSNTKRLTLSKKLSTKELKHALFDFLKAEDSYADINIILLFIIQRLYDKKELEYLSFLLPFLRKITHSSSSFPFFFHFYYFYITNFPFQTSFCLFIMYND